MQVHSYDSAIVKHLRPGERLLWVGRPRQGWGYRWRNRIILVQAAGTIFFLAWLIKSISWISNDLKKGHPITLPSKRSCIFALVFVGVIGWQLYSERRRRAGTWYAVTDRRIITVLTTVRPESVIAIEFGEIAQITLNPGQELAPPSNVILILKHVDPYLANSKVLGYQRSAKSILLEDLEFPNKFYEQVKAAKAAWAAVKAE